MDALEKKKCVRCGKTFDCGASDKNKPCWCMELPALTPLPKDVSDCLCRDCLEKEIKKTSAPSRP